mmetsp:Transcript_7884/g.9847  ORF Transcript_7884/g.9847 Transcript_7884/m.9847 type:complete len:111 (-) Transcript_7884:522-854(-)
MGHSSRVLWDFCILNRFFKVFFVRLTDISYRARWINNKKKIPPQSPQATGGENPTSNSIALKISGISLREAREISGKLGVVWIPGHVFKVLIEIGKIVIHLASDGVFGKL